MCLESPPLCQNGDPSAWTSSWGRGSSTTGPGRTWMWSLSEFRSGQENYPFVENALVHGIFFFCPSLIKLQYVNRNNKEWHWSIFKMNLVFKSLCNIYIFFISPVEAVKPFNLLLLGAVHITCLDPDDCCCGYIQYYYYDSVYPCGVINVDTCTPEAFTLYLVLDSNIFLPSTTNPTLYIDIFTNFINKCHKQFYSEAHIVAYTYNFHKILKFTTRMSNISLKQSVGLFGNSWLLKKSAFTWSTGKKI